MPVDGDSTSLRSAPNRHLHETSSAVKTTRSWTPLSPRRRLWAMDEQQHPVQLYPLHFLTYRGEQSPRQSPQQAIIIGRALIEIHWQSDLVAMMRSRRC